MFYTILTYLRCCNKKKIHPSTLSAQKYNTIMSNIRNFESLSGFDKEFIYNYTSHEQKFELIMLYDKCMKVLIKNVLYVLQPENENIFEEL